MKNIKYAVILSLFSSNAFAMETLIPNKDNALLFGGSFSNGLYTKSGAVAMRYNQVEILEKEGLVTKLEYKFPLDNLYTRYSEQLTSPKSKTPSLADTLASLEQTDGTTSDEAAVVNGDFTPLTTFVDNIENMDLSWLVDLHLYENKMLLTDEEDLLDAFYSVEYITEDDLRGSNNDVMRRLEHEKMIWDNCEMRITSWDGAIDFPPKTPKAYDHMYYGQDPYSRNQCATDAPHVSYIDVDLDNDGVDERIISVMYVYYTNPNVKVSIPINVMGASDPQTNMITSPTFFYKKNSGGEWVLFYQSAVKPNYIYDDGETRSLMFFQPSFGMSVSVNDIM